MNHEVRHQIQACIDSVENLEHENEELDELLRAFLSEVQRCYPAAPFTMRHISGQGIDLGDFGCIPPGFNITYAIAGTLLNDKHSYPNPKEFNIKRWLNEKEGIKPENWAFGGGCRTCPGRFLSVAESVALLRGVLGKKSGLNWRLKEGQDLNYFYTPGYFPKDGLQVQVVV
eukprot:scaffold22541_cov42-Cyclotella_meneghiniana.AAC.2